MGEETEDQEENEGGYESVDYNSHPSLSLALEEARNRYADEEDRRRTVETKIGILISVDAVVISIIASFNGIGSIFGIVSIFLALVSAAIGLTILWPRDYDRPGPDIGGIFAEAQREEAEFEKQFTNDYRAAIESNIDKNDTRYLFFKICAALTFSSIAIIFISQIPFSQICSALG